MSERELREWAESGGGTIVLCSGDEICADCQELYDVLAADPDVVAVLQMVERVLQDAVSLGAMPGIAAWHGLKLWIEDAYCVRLTDDGYEWMEEATE